MKKQVAEKVGKRAQLKIINKKERINMIEKFIWLVKK